MFLIFMQLTAEKDNLIRFSGWKIPWLSKNATNKFCGHKKKIVMNPLPRTFFILEIRKLHIIENLSKTL